MSSASKRKASASGSGPSRKKKSTDVLLAESSEDEEVDEEEEGEEVDEEEEEEDDDDDDDEDDKEDEEAAAGATEPIEAKVRTRRPSLQKKTALDSALDGWLKKEKEKAQQAFKAFQDGCAKLVALNQDTRKRLQENLEALSFTGRTLVRVTRTRGSISIEHTEQNLNWLICGDSGVGKTTLVKCLLYNPLKKLGVLTGKFVEVSPRMFKGKRDLQKNLEKAEGGMLFIDEAYGLSKSVALTELCAQLQPGAPGTVMVVLAGYEDKMNALLGENQGLSARFPNQITMPPYTVDELVKIGESIVKKHGFRLDDQAKAKLHEAAEYIVGIPRSNTIASRNANAINEVVGLTGAMRQANCRKGKMLRVMNNDKMLTKNLQDLKLLRGVWVDTALQRFKQKCMTKDEAFIEELAAALGRLYERLETPDKDLTNRREVFQRLSDEESAAWESWGSTDKRQKELQNALSPSTNNPPGSPFIVAFNEAVKRAFDGLEFKHNRGKTQPRQNGYITHELKIKKR